MNNMEILAFFWGKKEHYPISDEFIEGYQQKDDGNPFSYITYAHNTGHIVESRLHEPNQKWHLLEAYFLCKLIDEKCVDFRIGSFKCPELLLWMAEAAGVDENIVIEASKIAKSRIDEMRKTKPDSPYSAEAVKYMNEVFKEKYKKTLWEMTINCIKN